MLLLEMVHSCLSKINLWSMKNMFEVWGKETMNFFLIVYFFNFYLLLYILQAIFQFRKSVVKINNNDIN